MEAPQHRVARTLRVPFELEPGPAGEHLIEHGAVHRARERSAEAVVDAVAEGHVVEVRSVGIEARRLRKALRIVVRGREEHHDLLAGRHDAAVLEGHFLEGVPEERVVGGIEPESLLDRPREARRVGPEPPGLFGVEGELRDQVGQAVHARLEAGDAPQDAAGHQLGLRHALGVAGVRGSAYTPRFVPASPRIAATKARRSAPPRRGEVACEHARDGERPPPKVRLELVGEAEQIRDDARHERLRELGDEVRRAVADVGEAPYGLVGDGVLEPAHGGGQERLRDDPPEPRVLGRIDLGHHRVGRPRDADASRGRERPVVLRHLADVVVPAHDVEVVRPDVVRAPPACGATRTRGTDRRRRPRAAGRSHART